MRLTVFMIPIEVRHSRSQSKEPQQEQGGKKNYVGRETLPTSIKEKTTHWLRRAVSPLHHKATKQKVLTGIWMNRLAVRFLERRTSLKKKKNYAGSEDTPRIN
eukprot:976535-Pelagomonas_calceolata.AAC.1